MIKTFLNNRFLVLYVSPFLLGSLSTISFQPFNFTIINFIILPLIFFFITYINKKSKNVYRKRPYKKNFFLFGLLFGFGFYLSGISWITNSLTFDNNFKVLIPFALILIPLILSFFMAFTILIIGPFLKYNLQSIFIFSGSLAFSDYLRSKVFTGFPWNTWVYSTNWMVEFIQISNIIGLNAYNLIVITLFTSPIIIFYKYNLIKKLFSASLIIFTILTLFIYGSFEINKNKILLANAEKKVFVKVISPNFDLRYGLNENDIEQRFKKLIKYSDPDKDKKTLFIWPEGVFSGYSFNEISIFKKLISSNFSQNHQIIFGVNTLDQIKGKFYNSMIAVNNDFEIIQSYNKRKLVPFGEFLPLENFLNKFGLKKITEGHGSFLRGNKNKNFLINDLNILPLICYEVIFTEFVQNSDNATNLIINISEDGWFGDSIGPDQHFSKSIMRAVESNTFFLRSANKGVSAIIDNKGNIIKQLNRNEAGNIEFEVPLIKSNKIKNDLIFFILLITYLLIFLIYKKQNAK